MSLTSEVIVKIVIKLFSIKANHIITFEQKNDLERRKIILKYLKKHQKILNLIIFKSCIQHFLIHSIVLEIFKKYFRKNLIFIQNFNKFLVNQKII